MWVPGRSDDLLAVLWSGKAESFHPAAPEVDSWALSCQEFKARPSGVRSGVFQPDGSPRVRLILRTFRFQSATTQPVFDLSSPGATHPRNPGFRLWGGKSPSHPPGATPGLAECGDASKLVAQDEGMDFVSAFVGAHGFQVIGVAQW
jgi:hypothetical protein